MKSKNFVYYLATIILFSCLLMPDVMAWCPLGPDVTKDLYGMLKIFQIAAPCLCIALSIGDVIKTVAKGDAEAEMKKVATRFGKRVFFAALLFFLPVLVDQVMQIADVWGVDGTCDLTAPEDNGVSDPNADQKDNTEEEVKGKNPTRGTLPSKVTRDNS